jgi:hypothetical protein
MTDANDSEAVPCRDIDPADLFEEGLSPEGYHDLQEVTQEVISDRCTCKIVFTAEKCSRCSARITGIRIRGDVPELVYDLEWVINDLYGALYDNPRSVQYVDLAQELFELGPEAVIELNEALLLAAGIAKKDAEDGTAKRSKHEICVRVLGQEFVAAD